MTLASTPEPPYYAVIFTSVRGAGDDREYARAADRMAALAQDMPGFLGMESVRDSTGLGMTVSYWKDEAAIARWRDHAEHAAVREAGRRRFYAAYELRVARVERAYGFGRG
ncbi:hypothetical protein DDZ18_00035 [Marinicauda salina]|uniref:ABM domain-containing protein n=1 Tax=Marinicauda salina TaxID=2135793 RepID=A0A2U2BVJ7_9PROT|nr:antibiotic biosynthesis monooxygenase [Marinicauda salina]PWE18045.1 hypothetical protein DDZ18_00035 [Marinicauda salina]